MAFQSPRRPLLITRTLQPVLLPFHLWAHKALPLGSLPWVYCHTRCSTSWSPRYPEGHLGITAGGWSKGTAQHQNHRQRKMVQRAELPQRTITKGSRLLSLKLTSLLMLGAPQEGPPATAFQQPSASQGDTVHRCHRGLAPRLGRSFGLPEMLGGTLPLTGSPGTKYPLRASTALSEPPAPHPHPKPYTPRYF